VGRPGQRDYLHSPRFDLDEAALAIGAKLLARSAVELARPRI
jgi:metal-dependent amidase/aminoacylase/carboxypeptidase family protein